MKDFIEVADGIWYEKSTGLPWSSKRHIGKQINGGSTVAYDGPLKRLHGKAGSSSGYYTVRVKGIKKRFHHLVYKYFNGDIPKNMVIDHINNNKLDNRFFNLRVITQKENTRKKKMQKNNTSGFTGVSRKGNKWIASIRTDGKLMCLGTFSNKEYAYKAYLDAKVKFHGPESVTPLTPQAPIHFQ